MNTRKTAFTYRIISRYGDIYLPSRLPDLSACNLFFMGLLGKVKCFKNVRQCYTISNREFPMVMMPYHLQSFFAYSEVLWTKRISPSILMGDFWQVLFLGINFVMFLRWQTPVFKFALLWINFSNLWLNDMSENDAWTLTHSLLIFES
jgi:hypothetical protein